MASHFRLAAEWSPQSAVILTWPHVYSDWRSTIDDIETTYVSLVKAISQREKLIISCWDDQHRDRVKTLLKKHCIPLTAVSLFVVRTNDTWVRDNGPLAVNDESGNVVLLDFTFNGWGGKYPARLDNQLTRRLHYAEAFSGIRLETVDLVLEGGSIDVDGHGTLLTTKQCLLSPTRNPQCDQAQLERKLNALLGVNRFLWLKHGALEGDDTDGHVDMLARFCDPNTICHAACPDPADQHYGSLQAMAEELGAFRDWRGQPYRLVPLPWPNAKYDDEGRRLPATYANFLIINGAVLVPTYNDPADDNALRCLQQCFPARKIIGIPSLALVKQNGGLHCATMQLPRGVV